MRGILRLLVLCAVFGLLLGCGSTKGRIDEESPTPAPALAGGVKVRVVDVTNKTRELFDVDVIGMLWSSLDESLNQRGLLWRGEASPQPLTLEAEILEYQKGNIFMRPVLPMWGNTVLSVRCSIKENGREIASAETKQKISIGSDGFTTGAWRKIFLSVAEGLVTDLARKI